MGHFKVKAKNRLSDLKIGDVVNESDFASMSPDGTFVQLEYVEDRDELPPYKVKPGIWAIAKDMMGLTLVKTSFTKEDILEEFIYTKDITDKIDSFFSKLHVYKDFGIDVPTRKMMLYGPPGSGKTTAINKVAEKYASHGDTAVVVWHTDKFEAHTIKDFLKSFHYEPEVKKVILIVEDLGGVEVDEVRMRSESSLLSLLDNKESTFKIPTLVLSTTNFIQIFMGNLTNRPGRFDDKIKVSFPKAEYRKALLKFFSKDKATTEQMNLIESSKCDKFTPAHIRETIIRSAIYDKTMEAVIEELQQEIEIYNKGFDDRDRLGID